LEDRLSDRPLGQFIDVFSRVLMGAMVEYFNEYKGHHFRVPSALQKHWLAKED